VIPTVLVDIFALAYASGRFRSAWMGTIIHSAQSVVVIAVVLAAVLSWGRRVATLFAVDHGRPSSCETGDVHPVNA
jgi:hypothetical protein